MNISKTIQDGRFDLDITTEHNRIQVDVRVSFMPGIRGESIVLRYLDASKGIMNFEELGCEDFHIDILKKELGKSF